MQRWRMSVVFRAVMGIGEIYVVKHDVMPLRRFRCGRFGHGRFVQDVLNPCQCAAGESQHQGGQTDFEQLPVDRQGQYQKQQQGGRCERAIGQPPSSGQHQAQIAGFQQEAVGREPGCRFGFHRQQGLVMFVQVGLQALPDHPEPSKAADDGNALNVLQQC